MNKTLTLFLTLLTANTFAQKDLTKEAQPIVAEGKLLYQSEMASWYGTDLFLENYKDRSNIGGYFSYPDKGVSICIFFSKSDNPKVIGTIVFDSTYDIKTAKLDLTERVFSPTENNIYEIRKIALAEITSDTLFKTYENTNLNLIPLINEKEKKVYVLTGPQQNGVVIFGNDYLLTFNSNNKLILKKRLHHNIIPIYYNKEGEKGERSMHTHSPETGDFITATDICTLMLYEKFAKWKMHDVYSKEYLNMWNCETNELMVMTMKAVEKITKDHEEREKKRQKQE